MKWKTFLHFIVYMTLHCDVATAIPGWRVRRRRVVSVSKGLDREAGHHYSLLGLGQVPGGLLAGDGAGKQAQGLVLLSTVYNSIVFLLS